MLSCCLCCVCAFNGVCLWFERVCTLCTLLYHVMTMCACCCMRVLECVGCVRMCVCVFCVCVVIVWV